MPNFEILYSTTFRIPDIANLTDCFFLKILFYAVGTQYNFKSLFSETIADCWCSVVTADRVGSMVASKAEAAQLISSQQGVYDE